MARNDEIPLAVIYSTPEIPRERANRAAAMVIDCISLCPQQWAGALLVADLAVEHLQLGDQARKDVGILDLAGIRPDGLTCAKRITAIHEAVGVNGHPGPIMAANFVVRGAAQALDCIRDASRHHALEHSERFPADLERRFYNPGDPDVSEEFIDFTHAPKLYNLLAEDTELLSEVATDLLELADDFRRRTKELQADALAKGSH